MANIKGRAASDKPPKMKHQDELQKGMMMDANHPKMMEKNGMGMMKRMPERTK